MRRMTVIAAALLTVGCATVPQEAQGPDPKLQEVLAGKVAGRTASCIPLSETSNSEYFRDAIVYRQGRSRLWLAETNGCPLKNGSDYILVLDVRGSSVCRGDPIRLVERVGGFAAGACTFGKFTEYRSPRPMRDTRSGD